MSTNSRDTIIIGDLELDVTYHINPYQAATLLTPEEPEEVCIEEVICEGNDILEWLDKPAVDVLASALAKKAVTNAREGYSDLADANRQRYSHAA